MGMELPGIIQTGAYPDQKQKNIKLSPATGSARNISKVVNEKQEIPLTKDVEQALANLEKTVSQFNRRFKIYADNDINRIIIKVIDRETDKVIKEIPPKEIQHLLSKIDEMMGILVDRTI